ncbi:hypothetical protein POJ06DRAFT_235925 [Lipomyces tetrasporus]|uniref:Uncharacterized protein n=1 Tax=Lipomyces tetrasporus TaxID=54092 RepID=A0AAD7VUC4_9ASCO|nr:uncharacterized protein POJ06DRAFT_235925 [Lipomyces tetrasporus]KAJ8102982.1 hypothetical protein POJ06DRAFT_235925 [Lipomyces tetrasporus]
MSPPVSLSTSSPRCSPLILALSSAASTPSASPTAPISPALLALAAAPGTILGAHNPSQPMQVAAREAPSPLLLASSPVLATASANITPSSSTTTVTSPSPSPSPLLPASPSSASYHRHHQMKPRNPAFNMSMPSPPRFVSNANVNRMYTAQSAQQQQQQQANQPSDATPYLMPVGSPLGPVTPMLLADEEFQFPLPSTSPSLGSNLSLCSLSSSAGSTSSQSWARHRQMRYTQQQTGSTAGSAAGLARVATYSSSANPPTSSLLGSSLTGSTSNSCRQFSSISPSPSPLSPLSPLSPALSGSNPEDDDDEDVDDIRMEGM